LNFNDILILKLLLKFRYQIGHNFNLLGLLHVAWAIVVDLNHQFRKSRFFFIMLRHQKLNSLFERKRTFLMSPNI
jgi:hypothetical protein